MFAHKEMLVQGISAEDGQRQIHVLRITSRTIILDYIAKILILTFLAVSSYPE